MPERIPLSARLGVQRDDIVIDSPRVLVKNKLMERLPFETSSAGLVESEISGNAYSVYYLLSGSEGGFGSQSIEHAELIFGSKEAPCVASRTIFLDGKVFECGYLGHFLTNDVFVE
jgi:hypothetical protein